MAKSSQTRSGGLSHDHTAVDARERRENHRLGTRRLSALKRSAAASVPMGKIMHAEIKIGDSRVMVNDAMMGSKAPKTLGGLPSVMWLYVNDSDALFNRAVGAGAQVVMPLADQFWGDRGGAVSDPKGYTWWIASRRKISHRRKCSSALRSSSNSRRTADRSYARGPGVVRAPRGTRYRIVLIRVRDRSLHRGQSPQSNKPSRSSRLRCMMAFLVGATLALGLGSTICIADTAAQARTGAIRVEVVGGAVPVAGATVSAGGQSATTDTSGLATPALPAGPVSLIVTKDGYSTADNTRRRRRRRRARGAPRVDGGSDGARSGKRRGQHAHPCSRG